MDSSVRNRTRSLVVERMRPIQHWLYRRLIDIALARFERQNYSETIRWAHLASRVRSTAPEGWLIQSRAFARIGDYEQAVSAVAGVVSRHPSNPDANVLHAELLVQAGRREEAASAWAALSTNTIATFARESLVQVAELLHEHCFWEEALAIVRLPEVGGDTAAIEADCLDGLGRHQELWELLVDEHKSLEPKRLASLWAKANLEKGQLGRTVWWLRLSSPRHLDLPLAMRVCRELVGKGMVKEANETLTLTLEACRDISGADDLHLELLSEATALALQLGSNELSRDFAFVLVELYPNHPWTWLRLGRAHYALAELDQARGALEQSIAVRDDLLQSWSELARVLEATNASPVEQIAANRRIIELVGHHPKAVVTLKRLSVLGDRTFAQRQLNELVDRFPSDPTLKEANYELAIAAGRLDEAKESLESLESSLDVQDRLTLLRLALNEGDCARALEIAGAVSVSELDSRDAVRLGSCLKNAGELTKALRFLESCQIAHAQPSPLVGLVDSLRQQLLILQNANTLRPKRVGRAEPEPGRVLHIVGKSFPHTVTGYTVRTKYVVAAQRAIGIDSAVLTEPGFPWSIGVRVARTEEIVDGVSYIRCASPPTRDENHLDRMAEVIRRTRPAVLHAASDFRNAVNALELGRHFDLPVIYEVRGVWEETWVSVRSEEARKSEFYALRQRREKDCMLAADRVVTLSETLRSDLVRRGIPEAKITVVPNAVDTDLFTPQTRNRELAELWGIADEEITVGYISSLVPYEGINHLLEALSLLRQENPQVRGLIVGDGEARGELEETAEQLGLGDGVIFTGRIPHDEVLKYYGLIDVFVVPRTASRVCQLVTPLKPFEAMATGRAIVVSGVEALREIIHNNETGLEFEPENSFDLAAQIKKLIAHPDLRTSLTSNAVQYVRQNHTWAINAERYRQLYADLGAL